MSRQSIKEKETSGVTVPRRKDLLKAMRADMQQFLEDIEAMQESWLQTPLLRGFSIFPQGEEFALKPFGSLLGESQLAQGWREPFLSYEIDDGSLDVTAEVPGVQKGDIELDVGPDHIRLQAHGEHSNYKAFLQPGMNLDPDKVKATCKDGVLRITVPVVEEEAQRVRHIKVQ